MATVKLILDKRSKKQNGTYPIKISVFHKGKILISTDISINAEEWLGDNEKTPTAVRNINITLSILRNQAISAVYALRVAGRLNTMSTKELKSYIVNNSSNSDIDPLGDQAPPKTLVKDILAQIIKTARSEGTKSIYNQTLRKLAKYYDTETLALEDIKIGWIRNFEQMLHLDGLATNAIGVHLRNLRATFNRALDDELITNYPFRKYSIKTEQTKSRALTPQELITLRDYPCQEYQQKYRDIFMLMVYLVGINSVDLFNLKEINSGRIEYQRAKTKSKTGKWYSIKVEPEAVEIINRYQGKEFLLDISDGGKNYKNFLHRMNDALKEVGELEWVKNSAKKAEDRKKNKKKITPLFPKLSTYWSRHTWATIAAEIEIPDETISLALGHAGENRTTNIYIKRNEKKVDEANRKVLDYIRDWKENK